MEELLVGLEREPEESFNAVMQLMVEAGRMAREREQDIFPLPILKALLEKIFLHCQLVDLDELLLQAMNTYADVRLYCIRLIPDVLKAAEDRVLTAARLFNVLRRLNLPKGAKLDKTAKIMVVLSTQHEEEMRLIPGLRKEWTQLWVSWLQFVPFGVNSASLHRRILAAMEKRIIPFMSRPALLIDYLTAAYDAGGLTSILALSSLFHLIQFYNLDYPEFYQRLYALLDQRLIQMAAYRDDFLELFALFMQSDMLPAYLVAAILKRMARLALHAPPMACLWILAWSYNTLQAHPACRIMIHRDEVTVDPYLADEVDPAKCHALDSSLWELQQLTSHWHAPVARQAAILADRFTKLPYRLEEYFLQGSGEYEGELERELSHRWTKQPPLALDIPETLF